MTTATREQGVPARSGRRENGLHGAIIVMVALGYILVRIVIAPQTGPLRWYATDVLAGMALPSLFSLLFPATVELGRWARTLAGKLVLTAAAVAVWEGVMPLLNERSTADLLDVVAYLAGTLMQHGIVCSIAPRRAQLAS